MHDHQRTNLHILTWTSKWCFTNCSWNLTRPFHNSPFRSCIFDMMISYSLDIIITILWLHLIICKRRYVADGVAVGLVNICLQLRIEGKCVAHVPWRMSGSLTPRGGETFPAFPAHAQPTVLRMGLLPDAQNCGCACAGNAGNVFPVTAGKRSRHASRHVHHARAVMHAGIAN